MFGMRIRTVRRFGLALDLGGGYKIVKRIWRSTAGSVAV